MPVHDYTAREALELLVKHIDSLSPQLAMRIQLAVDEGKDVAVEDEEPTSSRRGRKPAKRFYRKNVPLTDEEALKVALIVLESHLVETRKVVAATHAEFKQVGLSPPKQADTIEPISKPYFEVGIGKLEPKTLEIEMEPETVQEKKNLPDLLLEPVNDDQLRGLQEILRKLKALTDFG